MPSSSPSEKFEVVQPPELNKFLPQPSAKARRYLRRTTASLLAGPILLLMILFLLQMWVTDTFERWPRMLVLPTILVLWVWLSTKFTTRKEARAKRVLGIHKRGFEYGSTGGYSDWKFLKAFRLEPVPGVPELTKLSLITRFRGTEFERDWKIIVPTQRQVELFVRRLKEVRSEGNWSFTIEKYDRPIPHLDTTITAAPWRCATAMWLMVLGWILASGAIAIGLKSDEPKPRRVIQETREPETSFERFLVKNFKSRRQVQYALGGVGGFFLVLGIGLALLEERSTKEQRLEMAQLQAEHRAKYPPSALL